MGGISWLASYPKSGNTWLRLFLASYRNDGNPIIPNALPHEYEIADHQDEHYHNVSPCPIATLSLIDILQLRGAVLIKILTDVRTRPLFVKTHNARVVLEDVRLIPDPYTGPSIYIVRDPRDVAISFAHWSCKGDVDEAIRVMEAASAKACNPSCKAIFHFLGTWSAHVMSWVRPDTLIIRYEDLIDQPAEIFTGVLNHLGIAVDSERVARAVASVAFDRLSKAEDQERFFELPPDVDRFFRAGRSGQWRDEMTGNQVARTTSAHGSVMEKFGYA
ncbi:MAG: sulfotransferase domain-containing protein [Alphaproteobacteria bacterium]